MVDSAIAVACHPRIFTCPSQAVLLIVDIARFALLAPLFWARSAFAAIRTPHADRDALRGDLLRRFLLAMGPAWIKIGQILSTRSDLLPPALTAALEPLQDRVPPLSRRAVARGLRQAYGETLPFAEFDLDPISAASVAQVHRARLPGGEEVAVKLVRPGISDALRRNVAILIVLMRLAARLSPALRPLQVPERLRDLRALILRQADMLCEAGHMEAIRANLAGHPFAIVPRAFPDLCRRNVLVMECMTGIPGREHGRVELPRDRLAARLVEVMQTMIYMHGTFHADVHPGNILFTREGRIILLDFGIVGEIGEAERWALASFYYAVIRKEWALAARRYVDAFALDRDAMERAWPEAEARMTACLRDHFEERVRWDTAAFTRDTVAIFAEYGARETTQWVQIELALVSLEGFVIQIDPDLDLWEASRRFNERYSLYLGKGMKQAFDGEFGVSIPASIAAAARARQSLVAPTHLDRYFLPAAYPMFVAKAKGCRITDIDGNEYIEVHGGYGPFVLGYAHPAIEAAIIRTLGQGNVCALATNEEAELMEVLVAAFPAAEKGIFANSGTEACQVAIKLCRAARGRKRIAKCEGHYHGFSDQGIVSSWFRVDGSTGRPVAIAGSAGTDESVAASTCVLQYGHPAAFAQLRAEAAELACLIVEPLPASMVRFDRAWLEGVRAICSEFGVPLVFDEVVTGFRVAYGGFQTAIGIEPDLTVLGKVIGGGLPVGAVVGRKALIEAGMSTGDPFRDYEERTFVGGTFAGNRLTCAAGLAQLSILRDDPGIYARLERMTERLVSEMRRVAGERSVACQINGLGSMFTISFRHRPPRFYRERFSGSDVRANIALAYFMRRAGVYMAELHTYFIGAAHGEAEIDVIVQAFDESLRLMARRGILGSA
jgi:glutamate-1-semialdehyde 2,1-aminomutase